MIRMRRCATVTSVCCWWADSSRRLATRCCRLPSAGNSWLRTRNELALGLVGLVQVIPIIVLSLPAGHVADQFNRRRIILVTQFLLALSSLGLALLSLSQGSLVLVYLCL